MPIWITLVRKDFYRIGQRLFRELKAYRILKTEAEWNRLANQIFTRA